jgi:RNA polymerase sigma factor (sigma-70 family)
MLSPYVKALAKVQILNKEEELRCFLKWKESRCSESKSRLIESNLRLVFSIARGYTKANSEDMLENLISAGNEGLIHALSRYDPTKGTKFSTYCGSWVLMYIRKYVLEEMPLIKQPSSVRRTAKMSESLRQKPRLVGIVDYSKNAQDVASDPATMYEDSVTSRYQDSVLAQAISCLPPREEKILNEYYGIRGQRKSLKEIGTALMLSSERIRQLRNSGESKLRRWLPLWGL